jgi:hypothetical protein
MKKGNILFLCLIVGSISGYFVLGLVVNSLSDKIALVSFMATILTFMYQYTEQKVSDNAKEHKETKEYIISEIADLKNYILNLIKDIKYSSESKDAKHDKDIELMTSKLEGLAISIKYHIEEQGHPYLLNEIFIIKKSLEELKALLNVQGKYSEVHLRLLTLENLIKSTTAFKQIDNKSLQDEIDSI